MENSSPRDLEAVQSALKDIAGRDFQLWCMGGLVAVVLSLGLLSFIVPQQFGIPAGVRVQLTYVPELASGLIALILLLNIYLINQRRTLNRATTMLLNQAIKSEQLMHMSFIDPVTQLFKREYLDHVLEVELARKTTQGTSLTFLAIRALESQTNKTTPDFAAEVAYLLRSVFRGTDTIIRYSETNFLVVMPETSPSQATNATARLFNRVDGWNVSANHHEEMVLFYELVPCGAGDALDDIKGAFFNLCGPRPSAALKLLANANRAIAHLQAD